MLELEEQNYIATKSHQEPSVFARGQNGVAQAQAPGVEDIISPIGPASVVR